MSVVTSYGQKPWGGVTGYGIYIYICCRIGYGRSGGGVLGAGFFTILNLQTLSGNYRSILVTSWESESGSVGLSKPIKRGGRQNLPFWSEMQWGGLNIG